MEGTLKRRKHQESNFELQITALVDTLVIILIFMLKSVATDSLELETSKGITVPMVVNGMTAGKGSRLDISAEVSAGPEELIEAIDLLSGARAERVAAEAALLNAVDSSLSAMLISSPLTRSSSSP